MKYSRICNQLLFDYEAMNSVELRNVAQKLPRKILRWLGANHPDNRTRCIFFELTGVKIGEETVINTGFTVSDGYMSLLTIGKRVAISPNVTVICQSGPNNSVLSNLYYVKKNLVIEKPVIIKDDVWIGCNAIILPGVKIGNMSVIGAGSVVNKDIPAMSIAYGIPASVKRRLLRSKR